MIRVLLVEDDGEFQESVVDILNRAGFDVNVKIAESKSSAIDVIDEDEFDYIILDQKIPTEDGMLDAETEHGRAVLEYILNQKIGTPICILTALSAERYFSTILRANKTLDIWGSGGKHPTIDHLKKGDLDKLPSIVGEVFKAIYGLGSVDIGFSNGKLEIKPQVKKLIRIFVLRVKGARCVIGSLSGGLSDSDVFRVDVIDDKGAIVQNAVLKIGDAEMVSSEQANFQYILRLNHDAAPHFLEAIEYGASKKAAVAFQLARDFDRCLFDILINDENISLCLERLDTLFGPWDTASIEQRKPISMMCP